MDERCLMGSISLTDWPSGWTTGHGGVGTIRDELMFFNEEQG